MVKSNKIFTFVQARLGSKRFKNKVLKKIFGKPLIKILLDRLKYSKMSKKIIVLVPSNNKNDQLFNLIKKFKYPVFRGSENDVLDRFYKAAIYYNADVVIRITADCPLIDPDIIDKAVKLFRKKKVDYLSNVRPPTFPDGLDVEVFSFNSLKYAWKNAKMKYDREHVTPFIVRSKKFKTFNFRNNIDYSDERFTVDKKEDFILIKNIIKKFYPNSRFSWKKIISLKKKNAEMFKINSYIKRKIN